MRENAQDYLYGEFRWELEAKFKELGLDVTVLGDNEILDENGQPRDIPHDKDMPSNIQIVPSEALMSSFEADYNEMRKSFIYGQSLDFSDLMARIKELQERFWAING